MFLHTLIAQDPRVGHDLNPRSYLSCQGHSEHIPKIRVRVITPHWQVGSGYFTQLLSMTQGCVMTLTQGHISKVKVLLHTYPKPYPGHNSSLSSWILIIYHTILSWPRLRVTSPRSKLMHCNSFQDHYLSQVTWMGWYFTQLLSMAQRLLLRGYLSC